MEHGVHAAGTAGGQIRHPVGPMLVIDGEIKPKFLPDGSRNTPATASAS